MTPQDVRDKVNYIKATYCGPGGGWDEEAAHGYEDELHQEVLAAIGLGSPNPMLLAQEALKTQDFKFDRWYA